MATYHASSSTPDTHPTETDPEPVLGLADKLTAGAYSRTTTAAVTILADTVGGRLLAGIPLDWEDDPAAEVDWPTARTDINGLSGGERRLFELADSIATGHPVDLNDTLVGLDPTNSRVVLDAIAFVYGLRPTSRKSRLTNDLTI